MIGLLLLAETTSDFDWDALRWVNVAASSLVVTLLVAGAWHRWHVMPPRIQRITPWVICTYVIIAYGSGEVAFMDDVAPGLRVALLTFNLIGLIIALLFRIDDDTYDR